MNRKAQGDYWESGGMVFVCDNWRWGVNKHGKTVSMGPAQKPPENLPDGEEVVTKPANKGITPAADIQAQNPPEVLLQKNKGGRPRKPDGEPVSRMTDWRRKKDAARQGQGVLL